MRTPVTAALFVTLVAATAHHATAAPAPSIDDIVGKSVAASGGEAALHNLNSLRLTGKLTFGGGDFSVEAQYGIVISRGKLRIEATLQGLTQIFTYDGKTAWKIDPFQGRREAEKLSADETRGLVRQAELLIPLADLKAQNDRAELVGTEDVDGTACIEVRVTRHDGDVEYIDLDPDSYLPLRMRTITKIRGTENVSESDLGAYEQTGGIWLPTAIDTGDPGAARTVKITVDRAEANVAVDAAMFDKPAAMTRMVAAGPPDTTQHAAIPPTPEKPAVLDGGTISGIGARNIGSATMSGRISAVAGYVQSHGKAGATTTLFVGAASGGVWKSLDGGTTFKPVFDKMTVQSIGAITIDPTSNGKTIWVGTGEAWTRNSVSVGDGIYKSTDGGETWTNMGLPESERIVRILVHPRNGNVVYACVPGKLWSDSKDRGVYKSIDGGKTWYKSLSGPNLSTGCSSLAMDPTNPEVLLAGTWDFRRKGWTFRSGGDGPDAPSGSGMYRSTDGGVHWTAVSTARGLPAGPWGRVEVAIAPSDKNVVYALIESKASSLYRSLDGGTTWEQRDHSQNMVWRPFYFARLVIDPTNPSRLFKPDLGLIVSEDGGASFASANGGSHGDWHDLWIDPTNPKHVVGGDDGGLWTSYDGGTRWWKSNNLPVSQFYHVSVDDKDPYNVYGGLQDNSSWVGPSAYPGGITNGRWENVYGGDGFWAIPDPNDPEAVYAESQGGYIGRIDRRTLAGRDLQPKAGYKEKLRFNWNTPIVASPVSKGTIYLGSQFLFRSRDKGDDLGSHLAGPDDERPREAEAGAVGRRHRRQLVGGDAHDDLLDQRVAEGRRA